LDIAKGQINLEEEAIKNPKFIPPLAGQNSKLFIDTNMYVMKVWCEFVFDKCHHWILNRIAERKYDLYLLCHTDLPWVKDELREHPDLESRKTLFHYYKDIMVNQNVPWVDISGNYEERLQKAIRAVESLSSLPPLQ
jgi:nicotinamide riboside kinase